MTRPTDTSSFWAVVDLFRTEPPPGWRPKNAEFARKPVIVRAAGSRWTLDAYLHAGADSSEIVVMMEQDGRHSTRGLSARRRLALFRFLETFERHMWRRGFGGSFDVDRHGDRKCSAYFNKYVKGTAAVRRELDALDKLLSAMATRRHGARGRQ